MEPSKHRPVLLKEVLEGLNLKKGDTVLDATVNRGGHACEICKNIGREGILVGIDQDQTAIDEARVRRERLGPDACRTILTVANYRHLDKILDEQKVWRIDAALFDLGFSSDQLESSGRGFTFQRDEPLLMTFKAEPEAGDVTAIDVVNAWSEESLSDIIYGFGGERYARTIARAIVGARTRGKIETTGQLVEVVRSAVPVNYTHERIHFATRTFQAIRMAVNDETGAIREGLTRAWERLNPGGRLAVISFHEIEDRMVKQFFKDKNPVTKKPITPSADEVKTNPRARSAKLRVAEKQ